MFDNESKQNGNNLTHWLQNHQNLMTYFWTCIFIIDGMVMIILHWIWSSKSSESSSSKIIFRKIILDHFSMSLPRKFVHCCFFYRGNLIFQSDVVRKKMNLNNQFFLPANLKQFNLNMSPCSVVFFCYHIWHL